jgi:hypothetical protein
MRLSTGVKVLAALLGFGLLILVAGREWQQARELLVAGLFIAFVLVLAALRGRPRRDAMREEAQRLGLAFSAKDRFDLVEPFDFFGSATRLYAETENVLWGRWRDLEVRVFDYSYQRSDDDRREMSCVLVAIPPGWPSLVIRPETVAARLTHLASPDLEFESEEFNRAFEVRCRSKRFANAFVDARMMGWLLALGGGWGFETQGPWLLGYRDRVQPWEIEGVLATAATFLDRIPRALRSLYPPSVPRRPDVPA